MENSKLLSLLKTFSKKEWRSFGDFMASPYFNKNSDLLSFYEYLKKIAPDFQEDMVIRENVFSNIYPGKKYDEKQLNYLMSFTLKLAEQFLAIQVLETDGIAIENYTLQALLGRKLDKHYRFIFNKTDQKLQKQNWRDTDYYYNRYLMANTDNRYFLQQKIRKYDDRLQKASDHLDHFYLCVKLRYFCEMLDRKQSIAAEYDLHLLKELKNYISNSDQADIPPVKIYYHLLLLLENDQDDSLFSDFMNLLPEYRSFFPKEEVKEIYAYAINYCIRKINRGQAKYLEELFTLYKYAVEQNLLLENDFLSPWAFKNMIGVALRLKKYEWTETFIKEYHAHLHPDFQRNALHYNLAELSYYRHDFDTALLELNKVEFSDIYYQLDTKKMMLKIYYEQHEIDAFYSLAAAFKMLLKRNKLVSSNNKAAYENFVTVLSLLIRDDPKYIPKIEKLLNETELLADRKWLKEQLKQLSF